MATTKERDVLAEKILLPVGRNATRLYHQVTGFLSMKGDRYDHKLMVVGRAVNGWTQGILPHELAEPLASERYAAEVFDSVAGSGRCPMTWVTDCWGNSGSNYNTKRSAFWRVIRAVVGETDIANINEGDWPSHLVWSNLYKVAPANGGNPDTTLCDIQFSGCLSLLEIELSNYCPYRLLLLTGLAWAEPFLQHISPGFKRVSNSYVEAIGQFNLASGITTKVVVAAHPQGKQEGEWVKEVMEAFNVCL